MAALGIMVASRSVMVAPRSVLLLLVSLHTSTAWSPLANRARSDAKQPNLATLLESGRSALLEMGVAESARWPSFGGAFLESFLAMSQNATAVQRRDWGNDLSKAFENFRVPAALVASSALFEAFALPPLPSDSLIVGVGKRTYLMCAIASFISSMITVSLATSALVQLNQKDKATASPAKGLEDFMNRAGYSLELWVAVNAHFIMGVTTLCLAVTLRCAMLPHAFGPIAALMVGSGLLLAVSLGMPGWSTITLPLRYVYLVGRRATNWRKPAPMLAIALLLAAASGVLAIREMLGFVRAAGGLASLWAASS